MVGVVVLRVHDLGEAEIGDLDVTADAPTSEKDVSWKNIFL